jgi:hypothetical protein
MRISLPGPPPRMSQGTLTRISYLTAPVFLLVYGVVFLVDGLDGTNGPGLAWTVGHVLFLVALGLFGLVLAGLRRLASTTTIVRRLTADLTTVVAFAGLIAFIRVVIIDLIVGLQATDHAAMVELFAQYEDDPAMLPAAVYLVAPALFVVGLAALLAQLALLHPRRLPAWSPGAVLLGGAIIEVNLDLLPLGAALFWLALAPLTWQRPAPGAPRAEDTAIEPAVPPGT